MAPGNWWIQQAIVLPVINSYITIWHRGTRLTAYSAPACVPATREIGKVFSASAIKGGLIRVAFSRHGNRC